jgi:hypothetical protein
MPVPALRRAGGGGMRLLSTPSVVIEKSATPLRLGDHADFSI